MGNAKYPLFGPIRIPHDQLAREPLTLSSTNATPWVVLGDSYSLFLTYRLDPTRPLERVLKGFSRGRGDGVPTKDLLETLLLDEMSILQRIQPCGGWVEECYERVFARLALPTRFFAPSSCVFHPSWPWGIGGHERLLQSVKPQISNSNQCYLLSSNSLQSGCAEGNSILRFSAQEIFPWS